MEIDEKNVKEFLKTLFGKTDVRQNVIQVFHLNQQIICNFY